ncbi:MAG TPA: hypothetical protein VIF37_19405 [Methylobacter sp.]
MIPQSVVNSEYREARASGLDCIVFVERQVWDLRPLFERNLTADLSPTVDNPAVFHFLQELCDDTKWIFPFTRTEEILTTLRVQLSTRLRDLLLRARENRLTVPVEFAAERYEISKIVVDKDSLWEYKLACELLRDRIKRLDAKYAELESGFVVRRTRFLAGRDTINYIQDLLRDLTTCIQAVSRILSDQLTPAFGPSGTPGDAVAIKRACDNLYSIFLSLYEWELDVRFVRPHEVFDPIFSGMHGWTSDLLTDLHSIPAELDKFLSEPNITGLHYITLVINAPKGLESLKKQFDQMSNDPKVHAALLSTS